MFFFYKFFTCVRFFSKAYKYHSIYYKIFDSLIENLINVKLIIFNINKENSDINSNKINSNSNISKNNDDNSW